MANHAPCFFLAPTWDYPPPPVGPIKLGSVIASVKIPERALFTAPIPSDSAAFSSSQHKVSFSTEKLRENKYGVFTKFLSPFVGAGVDAALNWDKSDTSLFEFESIVTTQFVPDTSFFNTCIASQDVQRFLEKSRYRRPVYVITGLKVVSGAKAKSLRSRAAGGEFTAEVDLTALGGAPVGIGPSVGVKKEDRQNVAWEGGDDFVFAFRVRRLSVKKDGTLKNDEDFKKGAMMDNLVEAPVRTEVTLISDEEADAEMEGFQRYEVLDDDEIVVCAIPTHQIDSEEE